MKSNTKPKPKTKAKKPRQTRNLIQPRPPRPRPRPILVILRWIVLAPLGLLAKLGEASSAVAVHAANTNAALDAKAANADKQKLHAEWQAHKNELIEQHETKLAETRREIDQLKSDAELLRLERDALLEVLERDRERVRAETAIASLRIAKSTGARLSEREQQEQEQSM